MNLQAVSLANASTPSPDASSSTPGQSNAAKPGSRPFNHVLGSLIAAGGKQREQGTSKKLVSTQDLPATQPPDANTPAKPIILPALLKFSLLFSTSKAATEPADDPAGSDRGASSKSLPTQMADLQTMVQAAIPAPTANISPPPSGIREPQGDSQLGKTAADLPNSLRLESLDPSYTDKPRLAVNTEDTQPLPKAELALSVKIAPLAAPVAGSTSATPVNLSLHPASIPSVANADPLSDTATGANQQSDTGADGDPAQASKQPVKQAKTAATVSQTATDVASALNNQSPTQVATLVTTPVPITVDPAPNATRTATKDESEPSTEPVDARPKVAALPDTAVASKTEPVRDLSIRIGNSGGNQVDVKIQERAGEVRVSVFSSSPGLTSDLRQQVGDLVGKLDHAGYHTETFKAAPPTSSGQSSNLSDQGQEKEASGGRQQQQQQETARQQILGRQKRTNQDQWLQQLNGSFGLTATEGIEKQ